ncbi:hypothetical protein H4219_005239 [Mycoemilia scoparia]|uniref:Uncharacterized protein n=1 Tax=Mycoemilia scoparia TaxID=417184 RepID=A0A9W7ZPW0_9FUNG|nr:hypothetical protein H4219_005239 [Mycoemilia scoparia]
MDQDSDIPRIQIEGREDVLFLQNQVRQALKEALLQNEEFRTTFSRIKSPNASEEEKKSLNATAKELEEFINAWSSQLWKLAGPNININGMQYEEAMKQQDMYEQFDEHLRDQVKNLENEADNLLLRITEQRKTVPQLIEKLEQDRIKRLSLLPEYAVAEEEGVLDSAEVTDKEFNMDGNWELPERLNTELKESIDDLTTANQNMPDVLDKLSELEKTIRDLEEIARQDEEGSNETYASGTSQKSTINALAPDAKSWNDQQPLSQNDQAAKSQQLENIFCKLASSHLNN